MSIGTRKKSQYVPEKGCISIDVLNLLPMIIRNDYENNPIYDIWSDYVINYINNIDSYNLYHKAFQTTSADLLLTKTSSLWVFEDP